MTGSLRLLHVGDPAVGDRLRSGLHGANDRFEVISTATVESAQDRIEDAEFACLILDDTAAELPATDLLHHIVTAASDRPEIVLLPGETDREPPGRTALQLLTWPSGVADPDYDGLATRIAEEADRIRPKSDLRDAERYREQLYRITTDSDATEEEKIRDALTLGCEFLNLENGHIVDITSHGDRHEVVTAVGSELVNAGDVSRLDETYCRETIQQDGLFTVFNAPAEGWSADPAYERWNIGCYIGAKVIIEGELFGTVCFASETPRETPFTAPERSFVDLLSRWLSQLYERQRHRSSLQTEKDRFALLVQEVETYAIFRLAPTGHILSWNAGARQIKGYRAEQVLGAHFSILYPETDRSEGLPEQLLERAHSEGWVQDEGKRRRNDGSLFWANVTITAITDDQGNVRGFAKVTRDLTERKRREERLAALDWMLGTFLDAESRLEVCRIAVDAADGDLALPFMAIALFREQAGELHSVAATTSVSDDADVSNLLARDSPAWTAFTSNEPTVSAGSAWDAPEHVERLAAYPLGTHGVALIGLPAPGITESDHELLQTAMTNLRDALDRIHREEQLHDREERLAARTVRLERLNRINDIIRTIDRALVAASSREEIEETVCVELADNGPYLFAWIGWYDAANARIDPRAHAGEGAGYLDAVTNTLDDQDRTNPTVHAAQTQEPQVLDRVHGEPPYESWREAALTRGFAAGMALPITYRDRLYGVLTVFSGDPDRLGELEQSVLSELADNVGHAINAVETQRALVSETVVELTLQIPRSQTPVLDRVPERPDQEIDIETVVPVEGGSYRLVCTVQEIPADELLAAIDPSPHIQDATVLGDSETSNRIAATATHESMMAWLLDQGARPQSLAIAGESAELTVELPDTEHVRAFVESVEARYAAVDLIRRRERQVNRSREDLLGQLVDELTPRQREVLGLAYASGYFESPRGQSASELAETLDISQPTFTEHLRAGQRKILGLFYDSRDPTLDN